MKFVEINFFREPGNQFTLVKSEAQTETFVTLLLVCCAVIVIMGGQNCAVIGCTNSTYRLEKWKKTSCTIHNGFVKGNCSCEPPFRLYCFPGQIRHNEKREKWIRLLRRIMQSKTPWKPGNNDRVCSEHFVDGIPTEVNPDPTLKLGYELPVSKPRRELFKHTVIEKKYCPPSTQPLEASEMSFHNEDISLSDHQYSMWSSISFEQQLSCSSCQTKDAFNKIVGKENSPS